MAVPMNRRRRLVLSAVGVALGMVCAAMVSVSVAAAGVLVPTETELSCESTTLEPGETTVCAATVTEVVSSPLAPTGEVAFTSGSSHLLPTAHCALRETQAGQARCQVAFDNPASEPTLPGPGSPGPRVGTFMRATYRGDDAHLGSRGEPIQFIVGYSGSSPERVAPETTIEHGPPHRTRSHLATFTFAADQPGAYFQCRLDGRPFRPCRSPNQIRVGPGHHVFQVEATVGVTVDPTPAKFAWTVLPYA
jgi:hypothetical protein